jgi:hypothetical protein
MCTDLLDELDGANLSGLNSVVLIIVGTYLMMEAAPAPEILSACNVQRRKEKHICVTFIVAWTLCLWLGLCRAE